MTSYSPLDEGRTVHKLVSPETFNQLLGLVKDEHKELAKHWWGQQLVQEGNLSDGEIIMLSGFLKHGASIIDRGGQLNWSRHTVTVAVMPKAIDDLRARKLVELVGNTIRATSNAAPYCCNVCYHTGEDRFRMMCMKCSGLGVLRNPRKELA